MPFRYRLQKFLEIRIRKKEEQLLVVIKAQNKVHQIENSIAENRQKIKQTIIDMKKSDPMTYDAFDKYLKHLWEIDEELQKKLQEAKEELKKEEDILKEREKEVKVLEKHKENKKEEFLKEENARELKVMNETGSQRHFAATLERKQEENAE